MQFPAGYFGEQGENKERMMRQRPVALVTGASRGIGKATAIRLAEEGFDVVVTARTMTEGQGIDESDGRAHGGSLPGSVERTATVVEEAGGQALAVRLDMLDRGSIAAAVARVFDAWGRIDVVVNNARHFPGSGKRIMDLEVESLDDNMQVNAVNPLYLIQLVLPGMIDRRGGTIINVTSMAGSQDPLRPAGGGGQPGVAYGMSKAALNRIAGVLHAEHRDDGILAYTISVSADTERHGLSRPAGSVASFVPPPSFPASAIAWLASGSRAAQALAGRLLVDADLVDAYDLDPFSGLSGSAGPP